MNSIAECESKDDIVTLNLDVGQYKGCNRKHESGNLIGPGTLFANDGSVYEGIFWNNYKLKTGKYVGNNGLITEGEFDEKGNIIYGKKEYYYDESFEGTWKNGRWDEGKYTNENGDVYEGIFENGELFEGIITFAGSENKVKFFEGNRNFGTYFYSNGDIYHYHGELENLKPNGYGTITYKRGVFKIYTGENRRGEPHGDGEMIYRTGDIFNGRFVNGFPTEGVLTYRNGEVYEGIIDQNRLRNGPGIERKIDGTIVTGTFDVYR